MCTVWHKVKIQQSIPKTQGIKFVGIDYDNLYLKRKVSSLVLNLYVEILLYFLLSLVLGFIFSRALSGSILKMLEATSILSKDIEANVVIPKTSIIEFNDLRVSFKSLLQKIACHRNKTKELATDILYVAGKERRAISKDLHDTIGQQLVAANLKVAAGKNEEARDLIKLASESLQNIYDDLEPRSFAVSNFHNLIKWYLFKFFSKEITFHIDVTAAKMLPKEICFQLYRIIQEAIANAKKHSANSEAMEVRISRLAHSYKLCIINDFDSSPKEKIGSTGRGLKNIQLRAESLGGICSVKKYSNRFELIVEFKYFEEEGK